MTDFASSALAVAASGIASIWVLGRRPPPGDTIPRSTARSIFDALLMHVAALLSGVPAIELHRSGVALVWAVAGVAPAALVIAALRATDARSDPQPSSAHPWSPPVATMVTAGLWGGALTVTYASSSGPVLLAFAFAGQMLATGGIQEQFRRWLAKP